MVNRVLRAATRQSPLALWQAEHVRGLLQAAHPGLTVELVPMQSEGDVRLDVPISAIGGKGVFAKEVQQAVLAERADFAVHSAKDLPAVTVDGLCLAAVPERGDPHDALVGATLDALPHGATVASGSQRRRAQLARLRPDLVFTELRGNMASRLSKVPDGGAIVVAVAAFQRLGLEEHLAQVLTVDQMVPQVGQGALGIECREGDVATRDLLAAIEHRTTRRRVDAERAFLAELGGDCDLPAGAHARVAGVQDEGILVLDAFLATDGTHQATVVSHRATGDDPEALGHAVARHLRQALGPQT
ncbi:hydroxymethylbilane synthase [soil metagenome]